MGILGALLHADAPVMVVASWEERRSGATSFEALSTRSAAPWGLHEEKLQEACRWLWWQLHFVTIIVISVGGAVAIGAALIGLLR